MKKLFLAALVAVISTSLFANVGKASTRKTAQLNTEITALVINDGVNVVLTDQAGSEIVFEGDASEIEKASFAIAGSELSIGSVDDGKDKQLVVYVPARLLKKIDINGASKVTTQQTLSTPTLKVTVNGECSFVVRTYGKIDVVSSEEYDFKLSRGVINA
jgi:Putative auto-transporter adhesin, head GIN domain